MNNAINTQGLEIIAAFAKQNKVSRAKIESVVQQVLALQEQPAPMKRARTKRDSYHAQIIACAKENNGEISRAALAAKGLKMVAYAFTTLEAEGKIVKVGQVKTSAGRGRPSFCYKLVA